MLDLTELAKSLGGPVMEKLIRYCEDEGKRKEGADSERFKVLGDELRHGAAADKARRVAERAERDRLERQGG